MKEILAVETRLEPQYNFDKRATNRSHLKPSPQTRSLIIKTVEDSINSIDTNAIDNILQKITNVETLIYRIEIYMIYITEYQKTLSGN